MGNIGWHRMPSNVVVNKSAAIAKIYYVPEQKLNSKMDEGQKEGIRAWNDMVMKLREAGLMEKEE